MDRNYYYRILGLQEGSSEKEIKKAYEVRINRLRSADYADDPEYVAKKISQVTYAYRVLTGSAAPLTRTQREKHYECYKDDVENNRDSEHFTEKHMRRLKRMDASAAKQKLQSIFDSGLSLGDSKRKTMSNKSAAKLILVAVFIAILVIVSAVFMLIDNLSFGTPEYDYIESDYARYNFDAVQRIMDRSQEYDFFGMLDGSESVSADKIEWEITDEIYDDLWGLNNELAYSMNIDDVSYALEYLTGDSEYYWEHSDYDNGEHLIALMGAPAYKEVAGFVNMYNNEPILDYREYMIFLISVAADQTEHVL